MTLPCAPGSQPCVGLATVSGRDGWLLWQPHVLESMWKPGQAAVNGAPAEQQITQHLHLARPSEEHPVLHSWLWLQLFPMILSRPFPGASTSGAGESLSANQVQREKRGCWLCPMLTEGSPESQSSVSITGTRGKAQEGWSFYEA